MSTCIRCGKDDHETRACRASFAKSWKGKPAIKMRIRSADGSFVEVEACLTEDMHDEAHAFLRRVITGTKSKGGK